MTIKEVLLRHRVRTAYRRSLRADNAATLARHQYRDATLALAEHVSPPGPAKLKALWPASMDRAAEIRETQLRA